MNLRTGKSLPRNIVGATKPGIQLPRVPIEFNNEMGKTKAEKLLKLH